MEENEIKNRVYSYVFYTLACAAFLLSIFSYNIILIIAIAVLLILSSAYLNSGHIINNFLIKRSNIIEVYNGYRLNPDSYSVFKKYGNYFHSVSVAILNVEKGAEQRADAVESVLNSVHEPFEFSISLTEVDKKQMLESIEIKVRMKEIMLRKTNSKSTDKINRIKREVNILNSELDTIRASQKAFQAVLRIKTFVDSANENEATRESYRNLIRIADTFSAALNVGYELLKGEQLLEFIEVIQ